MVEEDRHIRKIELNKWKVEKELERAQKEEFQLRDKIEKAKKEERDKHRKARTCRNVLSKYPIDIYIAIY